jgi:uncharacterized protein (DUF4415 family)
VTAAQAKKLKGKTDWARVDRLTDAQIVRAVKSDPDAELLTAEFWKHAKLVMPSRKVAVTVKLDPDVLAFFRRSGKGYQTRINAVLRSFMQHAPQQR